MGIIEIERLKKRKDFLRVAKHSKKWVTPNMVVQAGTLTNQKNKSARKVYLGFTVTKRVGNSVTRNRIRRRLKAATAQALTEIEPVGEELVIIGRIAALSSPFKTLINDLKWSMRKLNELLHKI